MELIEETKQIFDNPVGASSSQIWYRGEIKGEKDKIEIIIVICLSDSSMGKTIQYFTKDAYASPFILAQIPVMGERTWIPQDSSQGSYSMMFLRYNVFVRVFVRLQDIIIDQPRIMTETIARKIENKIIL